MKGYPLIFLLGAAIAALSGCAPNIKESEPNFAVHAHIDLSHDAIANQPGVHIESIHRVGSTEPAYVPSASAMILWLHAGKYEAKIDRCNQRSADDSNVIKYVKPLPSDHILPFSVETNRAYYFVCATEQDGTIHIELEEPIEVIGD